MSTSFAELAFDGSDLEIPVAGSTYSVYGLDVVDTGVRFTTLVNGAAVLIHAPWPSFPYLWEPTVGGTTGRTYFGDLAFTETDTVTVHFVNEFAGNSSLDAAGLNIDKHGVRFTFTSGATTEMLLVPWSNVSYLSQPRSAT